MKPRRSGLFRWIEASGQVMEILMRFGVLSASAVAAALGQFLLAAVLALVALGLFVRLWRGRLNDAKKPR